MPYSHRLRATTIWSGGARTSKVVQNLANPTEARDVVETDDDGEVNAERI
jgi:hypothetical protein